jgi:hypothetical protein
MTIVECFGGVSKRKPFKDNLVKKIQNPKSLCSICEMPPKAPVSAKSAAPVPAPTPVKEKAVETPAKAAPAPVKEKVAAAPAAPVASPVPAAAPAEETVGGASPLDVLEQKVASLLTLAKEALAALKVAKKEIEKVKKVAEKAERKRANARTSPSGFAKPAKISDELCAFLSVPKGTEMSRTDVTRHINQYVKTHNLFNKENKRVILPNAALKKLLGSKDTDTVTYFNLQRWLKGHFIRA